MALQIDRYGNGSNNAPACGRTMKITNQENGKSVSWGNLSLERKEGD